MRKISEKQILVFSFALLVFTFFVSACAKKAGYGQKTTTTTTTTTTATQVKVKDILSKEYTGKDVSFVGKITLECGSGCWFNLEDGTGKVYVDLLPSNFAIPQWVGKSVVVNGKVIEEDGEVKVIAKTVTLK
jgi:hypothetical protein